MTRREDELAKRVISLLLEDPGPHPPLGPPIDLEHHSPPYRPPRPCVQEDDEGYSRWLAIRGRPTREAPLKDVARRLASHLRHPPEVPREPLFSVLVPVHDPPMAPLLRCLESLLVQTWASFEAIFSLNGPVSVAARSLLEIAAKRDRRLKVIESQRAGISAATMAAAMESRGEYVCFLDQDDTIAPEALERYAIATRAHGPDIIYCDEDKIDPSGRYREPFFKPDFSPELLLATNYVCHFLAMRRSVFEEAGGLDPEKDGAQDWDLVLKATDSSRKVLHVPEVLYHWRMLQGSAASSADAKPYAAIAQKTAVEEALSRRGIRALIEEGPAPGTFRIRRTLGKGRDLLVSVVIPFRDEPRLLARCVRSLASLAGSLDVEFVLVDNGSKDPEIPLLVSELSASHAVKVLADERPFNWARLSNEGASAASGDVLVFANNDVEAVSQDWAEPLVALCESEGIGAVGPKLLYEDRLIQHAGVVIGLHGTADHLFRGLPETHPGYFCLAQLCREVSAVTGAFMCVSRRVYEEAGGFREDLSVAFNDIDFCLTLREMGLRNIYCPLVTLLHHESRTRGRGDDEEEARLFRKRWGAYLEEGDPYFNPNLSRFNAWCGLDV
jgi:GT2 family glycosyltransferase